MQRTSPPYYLFLIRVWIDDLKEIIVFSFRGIGPTSLRRILLKRKKRDITYLRFNILNIKYKDNTLTIFDYNKKKKKKNYFLIIKKIFNLKLIIKKKFFFIVIK